jgi:hypothetical protein
VNQLGRDTDQAKRLRTVTPHRLFLAVVSALASAHGESPADLRRILNSGSAASARRRDDRPPPTDAAGTGGPTDQQSGCVFPA